MYVLCISIPNFIDNYGLNFIQKGCFLNRKDVLHASKKFRFSFSETEEVVGVMMMRVNTRETDCDKVEENEWSTIAAYNRLLEPTN